MTRRAWALTTVVIWLVALGWLVQREYLGQSDGLSVLTAPLPPGATFFSVSLGDRQIGTASVTGDTLEAGGVRLITRHDLDLPIGSGIRQVVSATDAVYSNDLRLRRFDIHSAGLLDGHDRSGLVSGDSVVALTLGPVEAPEAVVRQAVPGPLELPAAVPLKLALTGSLVAGRTIEARIVDAANMTIRTEQMTVLRDSVMVLPDSADLDSASGMWVPASYDTLRAWQLASTRYGLPVTTWVDELGYVVASSTPLGFHYQRAAFELVSENYRRSGGVGEVSGYPLLGLDSLPRRSSIASARFLLSGGPQSEDEWAGVDIEHPWQARSGDTITTSLRPLDSLQVITMDYRLPWEEPEPWNELATGFDVDDPRIVAQARRIRRYERFVMPAVAKLVAWVADSIELAPPGTPATAWQVLDRRRGDASGQVALFLALAHDIGIPARAVAGLLHADGKFYYHSWAEVWLTEWVPVDPTLGQDFADPSHIRLAVGSLAQPLELQAMIGRLRPEVLSQEEAR